MSKRTRKPFTATHLRALLDYDARTGDLVWRQRISIRIVVGSIAGTATKSGYKTIGIEGVKHLAHRLVWLHVTGEWPRGDIDHVNGDGLDNRIGNLRDVPVTTNMQNRKTANVNSISGLLGVERKRDRWAARIKVGEKRLSLGVFDTPQEAHAAYVAAKRVLHAGCTI